MSHETFELIERLRRAGRPAAMATLVRTVGTTPRKEGTKMFVGDDGNIFGSVTIGGCVDGRVIEQSSEVLASTEPRLLNLQLGDEEAWEIGLTCGGGVDVLVEPLTQDLLRMYEKAEAEWKAGRSVAIATVIAGDDVGSRALVTETDLDCGGHAAALFSDEVRAVARQPHSRSKTIAVGPSEVYIEVLRPPATLVVFGGSAVAIPLLSFAKTLGFRTIVIDGRERFATRERFPDADQIRVGIASEIASQIQLGANTPIVLVAHDYKIDVPVLKRALSTDTPYIGLLGSRRRGAAILQMLRDEGVSDEKLSRIRTPVGLDIGGETAAEIALSIVSEVIAVMHGRSGAALTTTKREAVLQPS